MDIKVLLYCLPLLFYIHPMMEENIFNLTHRSGYHPGRKEIDLMKNPEPKPKLKWQIYRQFKTLTDFSRIMGMRDDRLSKIIHGRIEPTVAEKELISKKLGVAPQEIFSQD